MSDFYTGIMFKTGYFISIGAGKNQLPLILKLKELGLKVIAIDKSEKSPGFLHADIRIIESILNYRKIYSYLLKLFLQEPILGIGIRSYGKSVLTAAYLREKLNLVSPEIEILKKFYNKKTMKEFLGKNGVCVPKSYSWKNLRDISKLTNSISYPCILKPVNSIAKQGIEIFTNSKALRESLVRLQLQGNEFLLEEFIYGNEITVLGFVQNNKFILISISDKVTTSFPPFLELSHRLPSIQVKIKGEVKLICQRIAHLTGLENSPIVAEFKISPKGEIFLMEIMPEIGGEYLAEKLIPEFYTYDYFKNYIYLQLGKKVELVSAGQKRKNKFQSQICFISPPQGKSKFVSKVDETPLQVKKTFLNTQLKEIGEGLDSNSGNSCRVHVFGISALNDKEPQELDLAIRKAYNAKFE